MIINPQQLQDASNTIRFLSGRRRTKSKFRTIPACLWVCRTVWPFSGSDILNTTHRSQWPNRDRFVLSAGHGSMLLYFASVSCRLRAYNRRSSIVRPMGKQTPGHPEHGSTPGIETTTGPLGQGFGNAVGMAIAAKMKAERFNRAPYNIFGTHYVYASAADGDLMEGVTSEAPLWPPS